MRELVICLFVLWGLYNPIKPFTFPRASSLVSEENLLPMNRILTPMEALDEIQKEYASDFEKVGEAKDKYYYKSPLGNLFLVYEGDANEDNHYLFHLYEFIVEDTETGLGHIVTYGWYTWDKSKGNIIEKIEYYSQ